MRQQMTFITPSNHKIIYLKVFFKRNWLEILTLFKILGYPNKFPVFFGARYGGSAWAGWAYANPDFCRIEGASGQRRAALLLAPSYFQTLRHPCYSIRLLQRSLTDYTSPNEPIFHGHQGSLKVNHCLQKNPSISA